VTSCEKMWKETRNGCLELVRFEDWGCGDLVRKNADTLRKSEG